MIKAYPLSAECNADNVLTYALGELEEVHIVGTRKDGTVFMASYPTNAELARIRFKEARRLLKDYTEE